MKPWIVRATGIMILSAFFLMATAQNDTYEIKWYTVKSAAQEASTDLYLKDVWLPAMHRMGFKNIGIFKPISNDTASLKQIVVLVPYNSLEVWYKTKSSINGDPRYLQNAKPFLDADTGTIPFVRVSSTLLQAFEYHPKINQTILKTNPDAIYELRSYESPSEELHRIKVTMFNEGGEIALFNRLDFQAIFYGDVLSGNKMPNLEYMIVFKDSAARAAHWKAFGDSPEWKKISTDPEYRNNVSVSHIDSWLMRRTSYSDL
jgi:NIPSNAP